MCIRDRIHALRLQLDDVERQRERRRERRRKDGVQTAAIVGYTNAGKSTLLNALTEAGVLAAVSYTHLLDAIEGRPVENRVSAPILVARQS